MDPVRAKELEVKLKGQMVGGWTIDRLVNHGKSAAVFLGLSGTDRAAVKIFDDELIQKYGGHTQLERIKRELTLVGKNHRNIVQIFGGGFDDITANHYIVMEYLDGPNLAQTLLNVPRENVQSLIAQLASAAKYLEGLNLCHRDIKPENICILDGHSRLVLLDFGVIRPIGLSGLTDGEGIQAFVGTLQYSSPEFLLRKEDDTPDGWRALTFYQIGGVLHDLIMRKPLFREFAEPFARLVNAVQFEKVVVKSADYPPYLISLTENALTKDPKLRISLLSWSSFDVSKADPTGESAKERVLRRAMAARAQTPEPPNSIQNERLSNGLRREVLSYLGVAARRVRKDSDVFPPVNVSKDSGSGERLRIRIGRSAVRGLHEELTIIVSLSILDPAGSVIHVSGSTFCGSVDPVATEAACVDIFSGVYNSANQAPLYDAFESYMYRVLDVAQTRTAARLAETLSQPEWLAVV